MRHRGAMVALAIGALFVGASLLAAAPPAASSSGGHLDARDRGCYCHSATPSPNVGFAVSGLPGHYTPGANYTVEINVTVTDVGAVPNKSQGGFYLEASAGTLSIPASMEGLIRIEGNASTHTLNGSHFRRWYVNWTAPDVPDLVVTFYVIVNTVNGNGSETFGTDHWTTRTVRIGVGDAPEITGPPPPQPPFAMETFALLAFAAIAAGLSAITFLRARRRPVGPPPNAPKTGKDERP